MHSIRLTDHWTQSEIAPGRVRFMRRFGAPRLQGETVWLVGTSPGEGTMTVNDVQIAELQANGNYEVEITTLLKPRNEVWMEVTSNSTLGEVRMEIRT